MSTETLEANHAQTEETTTTSGQQDKQDKEVVALKLANQSGLLPGNRPVEAKHLQVVSTYGSISSVRPVMKSNLDIKSTLTISGKRPIVASHLNISQEYKVMGNRPVASNQIDDPLLLMGYLD